MTIAVGLQLFRGQWGTDFSLMAALTAAVLPIITLLSSPRNPPGIA
jgi:hypothetical protein